MSGQHSIHRVASNIPWVNPFVLNGKSKLESATGSEKGTYWDGCVDYATEYTGLPIHEAYHHMVQEHLTFADGIMEIPSLTGMSLSTFTFEVQFGAIEDLKLFVSADDKVVMTYYVCY